MILRALIAAASLAAAAALAQDYPAKPVRVLVGFPPGGATDLVARILQPRLAQAFKREIVVENRPGASGVLAADLTAKAAPDGYTLNLVSHSALVVSPAMTRVPYDPLQDFTPIARVVELPNVILARPTLAAQNLRELVALAKAKPGSLSYASPGPGSAGHLTGELFARTTGIDWVHVPYKGGGPAMTDFLGGQIDLFVGVVSTAVPYVQQGRARALGVSGVRRAAPLPDVPTVAESGWPEFEASTWYALLGPARLPPAIVERWHREIVAALAAPEIRQALLERGYEPAPSTPAAAMALLRAETVKWGPVVKALGLQTSN
ncbi:MAG TPA: tripartite tricarboxylate transporter substrate binding protein [Burkholderiales bacterium]|nr:tripartite tricarboxylate transporter substrate binding protein [Burkholderiales bacterium]